MSIATTHVHTLSEMDGLNYPLFFLKPHAQNCCNTKSDLKCCTGLNKLAVPKIDSSSSG